MVRLDSALLKGRKLEQGGMCRGLGSRLGHYRMPSSSSSASDSANRWEIHPSRVVIDRLPDGQLHKLGSGRQPQSACSWVQPCPCSDGSTGYATDLDMPYTDERTAKDLCNLPRRSNSAPRI